MKEDRCFSVLDGHRCVLDRRHDGPHLDFLDNRWGPRKCFSDAAVEAEAQADAADQRAQFTLPGDPE